jgi:hypothetical protein
MKQIGLKGAEFVLAVENEYIKIFKHVIPPTVHFSFHIFE